MTTTQTGGRVRRLWLGLLAAAMTCTVQAKADSRLQAQQYMEILGQIMTILEGHYVDSIDWAKAMDAGINAMLYELDPYTEFYSEEDQESWRTMTTGEYGGIGAVIQQHGDTVVIANPYVGMPAAAAGLRPGDQILRIDGVDMTGKTTADVSEKLRGEPGTTFVLTYRRPYTAEGPQELTIERRKVTTPAVPYHALLNDTTAYIQLDQFTDRAAQELQDALRALRQSAAAARPGQSLTGLVIDLRGNPGGLLEEAVKILGMFVDKGSIVVETKAKLMQWNATYRTAVQPIEPDLRIVVLQNRGSASAAEIVSGALQDMDRAVVMGERSFGKGLVQSSRTLPYNTVVKFTSAKYYIPSGRCIQAIDYTHRNEDGSVGRIPDSLTHVFHTAAGRPVRDGGGIMPDLDLAPQVMSNVLFMAVSRNVVFDYATRYRQEHDTIPSPADFHLTDAEYADFCRQLRANVTDSVTRRFQVFDLDGDLDSLRSEVACGIEQAICLRYYHQRGQTEKMLSGDSLVHRAAALLADPQRYAALLSPPAAQEQKRTPGAKGKAGQKAK